jgi:thiamine transport system ATP-binding protein
MRPRIRLQWVETRLGTSEFHFGLTLEGPGIVAISGPSGAGKSTLFHLIAGFEAPRHGTIELDGRDVTADPPGKRPLTYIFQDHNLFAHLDVFTNIALGISPSLRLSAAERTQISDALAKVGLAGFEHRMPQKLSGGERQRVAFARALVRKRPFLLLDEAFASLDETLRAGMGELLKKLQRENQMMVLMISHDRREIAALADQVTEIRDGRNVFSGNVAEWRQFVNFRE